MLLVILGVIKFIFVIGTLIFAVFLIQEISAKAPFVPILKETLPDIEKALNLHSDKEIVFYDLGSGDGRVLEYILKDYPSAQGVGIDRAFAPYILSRIKRVPRATFLRKNFFHVDLSSATHVFTYLFPNLLDELLPKLENELRPGTKLVSCDFCFRNKKPIEIIQLEKGTRRGRTLYVYEF